MNLDKLLNEPVVAAAVVPAVISAVIGIVVALVGFFATRRQARAVIEAEAMRLRYKVGDRYRRTFHEMADLLRAVLMETPHDACIAERYQKGWPHTPRNIRLYAELAMLPEDWNRVRVVELQLDSACAGLHGAIHQSCTDAAADSNSGGVSAVQGYSEVALKSLFYLMKAVDISSESRIGLKGRRTYRRELADLMKGWQAEMRNLRNILPDSVRIRQASIT